MTRFGNVNHKKNDDDDNYPVLAKHSIHSTLLLSSLAALVMVSALIYLAYLSTTVSPEISSPAAGTLDAPRLASEALRAADVHTRESLRLPAAPHHQDYHPTDRGHLSSPEHKSGRQHHPQEAERAKILWSPIRPALSHDAPAQHPAPVDPAVYIPPPPPPPLRRHAPRHRSARGGGADLPQPRAARDFAGADAEEEEALAAARASEDGPEVGKGGDDGDDGGGGAWQQARGSRGSARAGRRAGRIESRTGRGGEEQAVASGKRRGGRAAPHRVDFHDGGDGGGGHEAGGGGDGGGGEEVWKDGAGALAEGAERATREILSAVRTLRKFGMVFPKGHIDRAFSTAGRLESALLHTDHSD